MIDGMPRSALKLVEADYGLAAADIASVLNEWVVRSSLEQGGEPVTIAMNASSRS